MGAVRVCIESSTIMPLMDSKGLNQTNSTTAELFWLHSEGPKKSVHSGNRMGSPSSCDTSGNCLEVLGMCWLIVVQPNIGLGWL